MTVIVVERAPPALRGLLTRWLVEVRAGVYVGTLNARVRMRLWGAVCGRNPDGGCLMVCSAANEQKFEVYTYGDPSRELVDMEGLLLTRRPSEK